MLGVRPHAVFSEVLLHARDSGEDMLLNVLLRIEQIPLAPFGFKHSLGT